METYIISLLGLNSRRPFSSTSSVQQLKWDKHIYIEIDEKNITEAWVPLSDQGSIFQPAGPLAPHFSLATCAKISSSFATGEENISCKNIFLDLNLDQGGKNILFLEVLFVTPVTAGGSVKFLPVE